MRLITFAAEKKMKVHLLQLKRRWPSIKQIVANGENKKLTSAGWKLPAFFMPKSIVSGKLSAC
jgi:hypothetical protein